jgi:hypothetical protein
VLRRRFRCLLMWSASSSLMPSLMASFTFGFCPAKGLCGGNLAFYSRNCSSGIPMTTYPRFSPERDSTTISVLWATTSKRTLLLISNNEYGKCRMTRQQADFYEARGKAILEKTFPGPERADLRTGEVGICQFVEKRSFQEATGDVNHEGAKSGSLQ